MLRNRFTPSSQRLLADSRIAVRNCPNGTEPGHGNDKGKEHGASVLRKHGSSKLDWYNRETVAILSRPNATSAANRRK